MKTAMCYDGGRVASPAKIMDTIQDINCPSMRAAIWAGAYMALYREYLESLNRRDKTAIAIRADANN